MVTVPVGCTIREAVEKARTGDIQEVTGVWEEADRPFYVKSGGRPETMVTVPRTSQRLHLIDPMPWDLLVLEERTVRAAWWSLAAKEAVLGERKHWGILPLDSFVCCSAGMSRDRWVPRAFLDAEVNPEGGAPLREVPSTCMHEKCIRPVDTTLPWYNLCTGCEPYGGWVSECTSCGGEETASTMPSLRECYKAAAVTRPESARHPSGAVRCSLSFVCFCLACSALSLSSIRA